MGEAVFRQAKGREKILAEDFTGMNGGMRFQVELETKLLQDRFRHGSWFRRPFPVRFQNALSFPVRFHLACVWGTSFPVSTPSAGNGKRVFVMGFRWLHSHALSCARVRRL